MQIKEHIDEVINKTRDYNETVSSLKNELNELKNDIRDVKLNQTELLRNLKDGIGEIDDVKEDLKKELYEFNLLKSKLQSKILEKFENELQNELKINLEKLKTEHRNYDDARKELALIVEKTTKLGEELNKFIEISKDIKKEDFMLTKFCNKIWEMDKEKLELMKRIDILERLIAKMRRSDNR